VAFNGADITTILSEIQNASYGLSALNIDLDALLARLTAARAGYLDNLNIGENVAGTSQVDEVEGLLKNVTYGLSALNTDLDTLITRLGDPSPSSIKALIDSIQSKLDNGTYGLSALETLVDEVESLLKDGTFGLSALNTDLDTLLTRVPAEITQRAKSLFKIVEKFFASSVRLTITGTAGNVTIKSNFSISLIPSNVIIDYVHIYVFSQVTENTNASANKVNGAQNIQIQKTVGGTWTNCVNILDDALRVPASTRDMGRLLGVPVDCKSEVTGNGSYNLQWTSAQMDLDSLYLDDVFFLIEVGFH